ncbi:MAG: CotH kinase family protein [Anaerolineales bacterium]|nr:CotH kinase family protein [Anaerolineales bacterium]
MTVAKRTDLHRIVELASIPVFVLLVVLVIWLNPTQGQIVASQQTPDPAIKAYAIAMPNQGWAPMTVYFSAFGSESGLGAITRYEWDLDGNGLYDTDASAGGGYTSYHYAKPGQYNVTLRVTDQTGRTATDSVLINVRHPGSSSVDYWSVFDDSQLRRVDVALTTADWNWMWSDIEAKIEVPADVVVFGERIEDIGFRMRGQFSMRMSGAKKPWKFNLDAYVEGQEYHNLRQLMFTNNIGDPSMLKEKLAYDMMHFAGVPASHVCFVEIWIDFTDDAQPPIFWGVYTMIERVDKKFLSSRFVQDSKGGNLYKANHALRGPMDLVYHGPNIENYPTQNGLYAYGKATNEEAADYTDILNLIALIDGVEYKTPDDFAAALESAFNVDTFLRYMAVVFMLGNWDSYPYTGNNYYLFNNSISGKFEWIPWDLTWGGDVQFPILGEQGQGMVESAPLFDKVFQVGRYRTRYAGYLDLLARQWFTGQNVSALASQYYDLISPAVYQATGDKMIYGSSPMFPPEAFENSWQELADFAQQRNVFVLQELADGSWKTQNMTGTND